MNLNGSGFQYLAQINGSGGSSPIGQMVVSGSTLYGATFGDSGIYSGSPTIFSVNLDGSDLHSLHTYAGAPGSGSSALTLVGSELYGTTASGGTYGRGTLFSMNLDGSNYQTLYSFDSTNHGGSQLTLIGSKLFGTGETGTNYNNIAGTIYSINLDGTGIQTLHSFPGSFASQYLTFSGSTIFGTTPYDSNPALGNAPNGSIFSINVDGTSFQTLHTMSGSDGTEPFYGVTLLDGKLFGVNLNIGSFGSIFSLNPDGSNFQTVFNLVNQDLNQPYSQQPNAPLVAVANTLYGTTNFSSDGGGTVFALTVPEPASLALAVMAAVGAAALRFRRRR